MSEAVLFEELPAVHGYRIGIATLNVEKTLNALSLEMTDLLTGRLTQWAADAGIAMVILQGSGEKAHRQRQNDEHHGRLWTGLTILQRAREHGRGHRS